MVLNIVPNCCQQQSVLWYVVDAPALKAEMKMAFNNVLLIMIFFFSRLEDALAEASVSNLGVPTFIHCVMGFIIFTSLMTLYFCISPLNSLSGLLSFPFF